jgi:thiosulfate dehydrogenase [quinone] large subunit
LPKIAGAVKIGQQHDLGRNFMAQTDVAASSRGMGLSALLATIQSAGDMQIAYSAFRMTLGMNIFFHGAMRLITGLDAWATMEAGLFTKQTLLPMWSVSAFLHVLPFVEVVLGALTFVGLFTRWALIGGSVLLLLLVFGNDVRQDWNTVGNNMHYVLYYAGLIAALRYNAFALDTRKSAKT